MPMLRTLLASALLLVLGGAVLTVATDGFHAFTSETARRLAVRHDPPPVPAVTLETQSGAHVKLAELRGRWVLVDFIYTRCLTWCLALGGEFAQLQDQLATPLADGRLVLLSISFDPAHDTPAELAAYRQRFRGRDHGWLIARPTSKNDLRQLLRTFGVTVVPDGMGGYVHNAAIQVVDPQGRLVRILDGGNPQAVAQVMRRKLP
ncbi:MULTISPECIES: SCO family protein [Rhodanobacter]|uniref:SCO family protein n=1 Tax=Rhodanobacter TaxID=75309 RepID=UPI000489C3CB|nr:MULTISPECIES: SCO family protein [Rhodanobacter]TAN19220.1 MAG: SCO family protein [Rhodanobacter sp.]UJJ53891.1 SCO family protein [Rhodanobacter thiooxydans]